uniref:Uroporphyrinogen III methyltransferase n=1 Tax=Paulinella micropora TaxID=1928728 RepID=A0A385HZY9_9EUKA|nr:uroporphyrinogen III methyltransferase [Paulinella micropora]AXY63233.1 uroporphyrinogen III methyltransferase [Paulinella micropora]
MSSHLSSFQIVLTRAEKQQSNAIRLFKEAGITILDLPALEINSPNNWNPMDKALESLNSFDWLLLSSTNGVEALEKRLTTVGYGLNTLPPNLKIASIGYKTSLALEKLGYMSDYIPPDFVADSLVTYFPASNIDIKILAIRVQNGGRTFLAEAFREVGVKFIEVAGYQSNCPKTFPKKTFEAFITQEVSAVTFTSSKIVQHTCRLLEKLFGTSWREQLKSTAIISIGPQTTITCHKWLGRVDAEANPHNLEGLVTASLEVLNQKSTKFI